MSDYTNKRNSFLPTRKQQEVPVKPEKEIKVGDITEDGYKVCHLYEDDRVLLSSKDGTKVIHKSDIK